MEAAFLSGRLKATAQKDRKHERGLSRVRKLKRCQRGQALKPALHRSLKTRKIIVRCDENEIAPAQRCEILNQSEFARIIAQANHRNVRPQRISKLARILPAQRGKNTGFCE